MSTLSVNKIVDASGGVLAPISSVMRNRIINGAMVIDQRNAGASVTPTVLFNTYTLDRWNTSYSVASKFSVQQNAGSVTPPVGFTNYLGVTSLSAYAVAAGEAFAIAQAIEGFNTADLNWGTANAKTVTLSFWVRSSLTGTFGGALRNSDADRSYPFTYTISAATTWEYKTVTIAGDTSGTWLKTNGVGIQLLFGLGVGTTRSGTAGAWAGANYISATGATSVVGTNAATWYVTGCQLEVGTQATSFEYRQYGTELALCQRYFEKSYDIGTTPGANSDTGALLLVCPGNVNRVFGSIQLRVSKRGSTTYTIYSTTGASGNVRDITAAADKAVSLATNAGENGVGLNCSAGISAVTNTVAFQYTASAEL